MRSFDEMAGLNESDLMEGKSGKKLGKYGMSLVADNTEDAVKMLKRLVNVVWKSDKKLAKEAMDVQVRLASDALDLRATADALSSARKALEVAMDALVSH